MKLHHEKQGSGAWLALRERYFTASEAPAMMGMSAYMNRAELLRQKATGITPDHDPATLARFNRGHEAEAQFRPIAEKMIGGELYPVVGSIEYEGLNLLASFDGITLMEDVIFEHKLWNEKLADAIKAGDLPDTHWPQVEHQLLVCGAEECLFVTSDGTNDQFSALHYTSEPARRQRVIDGWKQFAIDLANYQPEIITEKPKGAAVIDLPAVMVKVSGQIAITDNLDKFSSALKLFVDTQLIREPKTDQDFADLEAQVKTLKKAEEALDSAEAHMLAQVDAVDTAKRTIDMLRKIARDNRLMAEKLVKTEKENIKTAAIMNARKLFMDHISALNAEIRPAQIEGVTPDFNGAAKNKRTMASLHDAIDTELARVKIESDAQAKDIRLNLALLKEHGKGYEFLFNDLASIAHKESDDFIAVVSNRIASHKVAEAQKLEAERLRIQAEEEAKARAKVEAEQREAERVKAQGEAEVQEKIRANQRAAAEEIERQNAAAKVAAEKSAETSGPDMVEIAEIVSTAPEQIETVLLIRSAYQPEFIRKMVADSLAKYGVVVDSVELDEVVV